MSLQKIKVGVVCLARGTFDVEAARGLYAAIQDKLEQVPDASFECVPQLLIEPNEACEAGERLRREGVDALICISGTFHLGHLVLELQSRVQQPVLLWGLPELPYDGGKIRLNSVCGVNLNASNLYKSGDRSYHATVGMELDADWLDAVRMRAALRHARVGLVGYRAHGFFNLGINELATHGDTGILVDHFELQELLQTPAAESDVKRERAGVLSTFDVSEIDETQLSRVAGLTVRLRSFFEKHGLSALAIRCWPEFADTYGISPCAAMSRLQSEGLLLACEGDLDGALSMMAHAAVSDSPPFLANLSQIDLEADEALLWHCGVAPCNLWDGCCARTLDTYFAGGRGVTAGFVLREGPMSILRIDSDGAQRRLFVEEGTALPMEKRLKGTYLKVRFDVPMRRVFDRLIKTGVAHHVSVSYGKHRRAVELLGRIQGWQVLTDPERS